MSNLLPETDSEDEVPRGWEERVTSDGRVFYANHETKSTQWVHPRSGKRKKVSNELPYGWVKQTREDGSVIFVDQINNKTSHTDPRLAFAVEEKANPDDIRSRFDSSSTANHVLLGRDLTGKVAVVTGANCGIGLETAKALAFHGCHVIMACRDVEKANEAIELLKKERSSAKLQVIKCDLASLKSVEYFVQQFLKLNIPLHCLILNAGIFSAPHSLTEDGIEITFQVNYLSHFYLTNLLKEKLIESSPSRVIVLSSESHRFSTLTKDNLTEERVSPSSNRGFVPMMAYNDSKLCGLLFSNELNKLLSGHGVNSNAVHPGNMISTYIARNWWFYRLLFALVRPFTKSLEQGASTTIYCATSYDLDNIGGRYFNNCCQCSPSSSSTDVDFSKLFWSLSEKMIENAKERHSITL